MSRIKRWFNANKGKFDLDGTLKNEAREKMLRRGISHAAIDDYVLRMQEEYDHLKHLDETDPEPWPIYTAYDFFTAEEKQQFNPDGSLKPEYVEAAVKKGTSERWLEEMGRRKKIDVDNYNKVSAKKAEQGINFGEQEMNVRVSASRTYVQRLHQMEVDLRNFEDTDSLPFDKDTSY
ncbi:hypothetical protein [Nostoc sp. MG11]|uniref:hypothetical protein n=1 Tax=Nostoc sp. MG11 TaxID=2721166 RepID=UPI001866B255|nr:hypothetical protein [Nostoc sp. MG11]